MTSLFGGSRKRRATPAADRAAAAAAVETDVSLAPLFVDSIDSSMRPYIERARLLRMLAAMSREPSENEMERLRALVKAICPKARPGQLFVGMHAVTLTQENKNELDVHGFASLKADGVHCHLARVNLRTDMVDAAGEQREQTAAELIERYDAVLLVGRDNSVRAIDRVLLLNENKRLMLDGELCLRKIKLSDEERLRVNSSFNVHQRSYLDYYGYADEAAARAGVDITSDQHQSQYDKYYELVYAAFDCLFVHARSTGNKYLERITLVHNVTETLLTQTATPAYRKRRLLIDKMVEYAGSRFQLTVFLKPTWPVKDCAAAMHAVPAAMQGIATDGVIFNPNDSAYTSSANPRLLKFKPHHTADFRFMIDSVGQIVVQVTNTEDAGANESATLSKVLSQVRADTPNARRLIEATPTWKMACRPYILECEAIIESVPGQPTTIRDVWWRPVHHRSDKRKPNTYANYKGIVEALLHPMPEQAVIEHVLAKLAAESTANGGAPLSGSATAASGLK